MQKKYIAFILILLIVSFQNCTGLSSTIPQQGSIKAKGNGDGYAGLVKFIDIDLNNTCGGSSKAEIEVTNGTSGMITKENCQPITPRPVDLSVLGLMPHDPTHLIFQESLFQVLSSSGPSILLCRANSTNPMGTENYVLDTVVRANSSGLVSEVHLGIYDLSMTLKRTISRDYPVAQQPPPVPGATLYVGLVEPYVLQLNASSTSTYTGMVIVSVPDPENPGAFISMPVPGVTCNLP